MKKLCQIAIYENEELKYLENAKGEIFFNLPYSFPCVLECEIFEFANEEDCLNLINLVKNDTRYIQLTENEINLASSIRTAVQNKLIGIV